MEKRPPGGLLRRFLRPYAWQVGALLALLLIQVGGTLYLPDLSADIINNGVVNGDTGYIWRTGGEMLGIALIVCLVSIPAGYIASWVSMSVGADVRAAIYRRVRGFSLREMNRFGVASLVTRNLNDVQQFQLFLLSGLSLIGVAAITCIGGVILAARESAELSALLIVVIPAVAVVLGAIIIALMPMFRAEQAKIDRIGGILRDQITGARVIRAFRREATEQHRFRAVNSDLTRIVLRANRIVVVILPVLTVVVSLTMAGVLWFGGHLVNDGSVPIGNLIAFRSYIQQILFAVIIAVVFLIEVPRAVAAAERIEQVIDAVPDIADPPRPAEPVRNDGTVEFRHVSFGYPGSERRVLRDLTFRLEPGQTTAIIGGTGSGKTTLLNLVPRFLDVSAGAVLVNGVDVREQAAEQLWSVIGLAPQPAFLFRGTVASNLRFARPDASDACLWHALEIAQAAGFVADLPGRLEASIDQGGMNLSGGQRQRLAIARALVRRPRVYLLDDCFSALDYATEACLRDALREEAADASVLVVAQRITSVMHADQIIVLDAGGIAGIGTHEKLLAECELYKQVARSQADAGAPA
jgi:ABC-type multidrug transport system fused ATPase/permease subunit